MKTVAECLDQGGNLLEHKEFSEKNPYPGAQPLYSRHASVDRDGAIHIEDSNGQNTINSKKLTKEETEAIQRNVDDQKRRINMHIEQNQQHLQQQMEELHRTMENTFGNAFSFGNNFPFYNPYLPRRNNLYNYY